MPNFGGFVIPSSRTANLYALTLCGLIRLSFYLVWMLCINMLNEIANAIYWVGVLFYFWMYIYCYYLNSITFDINIKLIQCIIIVVFIEKQRFSLCVGCGAQNHDQYILRVAPDLEWHAACLKCQECRQFLDESCTCFVRDGKTYCKRDYVRWGRVWCCFFSVWWFCFYHSKQYVFYLYTYFFCNNKKNDV